MISKYEFQFSFLSQSVTKIAMTVAAVLTFSHIVVQLFGQTIPDLFWPVFKDIGAGFIIFAAFAFAVALAGTVGIVEIAKTIEIAGTNQAAQKDSFVLNS